MRLIPDNQPDTSSDTSAIVTLWGAVYTAAALCRNESFAGDGDENKALEQYKSVHRHDINLAYIL